ncbi:hypothetical protein M427DRAFT_31028 [Gonapodya prolifera JEL478]|uniref:Uncharacterized protein n=1 Tax=Gonapodya prolifera (strain JEL478) TaxID=1344416 RepID=A0A139AIJ6_GONPJ|nr:hypothetical protein M427DRAFT_31028 [Gonapodya prolifera JEL478]|eukprot:KXS16610.1 hypothetical protein M427DRAFT_31028 [Gonapodya prolifera JEL478]
MVRLMGVLQPPKPAPHFNDLNLQPFVSSLLPAGHTIPPPDADPAMYPTPPPMDLDDLLRMVLPGSGSGASALSLGFGVGAGAGLGGAVGMMPGAGAGAGRRAASGAPPFVPVEPPRPVGIEEMLEAGRPDFVPESP